eukprot:gene18160-24590_t
MDYPTLDEEALKAVCSELFDIAQNGLKHVLTQSGVLDLDGGVSAFQMQRMQEVISMTARKVQRSFLLSVEADVCPEIERIRLDSFRTSHHVDLEDQLQRSSANSQKVDSSMSSHSSLSLGQHSYQLNTGQVTRGQVAPFQQTQQGLIFMSNYDMMMSTSEELSSGNVELGVDASSALFYSSTGHNCTSENGSHGSHGSPSSSGNLYSLAGGGDGFSSLDGPQGVHQSTQGSNSRLKAQEIERIMKAASMRVSLSMQGSSIHPDNRDLDIDLAGLLNSNCNIMGQVAPQGPPITAADLPHLTDMAQYVPNTRPPRANLGMMTRQSNGPHGNVHYQHRSPQSLPLDTMLMPGGHYNVGPSEFPIPLSMSVSHLSSNSNVGTSDEPSASWSGKGVLHNTRLGVLPPAVQSRVLEVAQALTIIQVSDFDEKVVKKMCFLSETYGLAECLKMLDKLALRMRSKSSVMKNGAGYLDVAVSSHLDMLMAHRTSFGTSSIEEYAKKMLSPMVLDRLTKSINTNPWLQWDHMDQGIIQLLTKLPEQGALMRLQEVASRSFRGVENVTGCIASILNPRNKCSPQEGGGPAAPPKQA